MRCRWRSEPRRRRRRHTPCFKMGGSWSVMSSSSRGVREAGMVSACDVSRTAGVCCQPRAGRRDRLRVHRTAGAAATLSPLGATFASVVTDRDHDRGYGGRPCAGCVQAMPSSLGPAIAGHIQFQAWVGGGRAGLGAMAGCLATPGLDSASGCSMGSPSGVPPSMWSSWRPASGTGVVPFRSPS